MKKKLLVLLGAGSSVEQGVPSTPDLDLEVAKWANEHAAQMKNPDFYHLLWENRADYCRGIPDEAKGLAEQRTAPNYERVLGDLHALMNGVLGRPFGDPVLQWVAKANIFDGLDLMPDPTEWAEHRSNKNFYAVLGQLQKLTDSLADRFRGASGLFEIELKMGRGTKAFEPYRTLFAALALEFDLGVYNLNHDTVAVNALPDAFVGFDKKRGQFLPSRVLSSTEWNFVYHLHGTAHHRMRSGSNVTEDLDHGPRITWDEDFSQTGDHEDWMDPGGLSTKTDGKRVLFTTLVTGGWKLDQIQEDPFLTFYSCFPRHVHEADAILIGGYGFGDPHINSVINNAIRSKTAGAHLPPVVVLDYDKKGRSVVARYPEP